MLATTTEKPSSMKGLVKTLRRRWLRGTYTDFDSLLMQILDCSREKAEKIRESWEDLSILGYDSDGFLVWCNGWLKP